MLLKAMHGKRLNHTAAVTNPSITGLLALSLLLP
jgi:hypothetical protein